MSPSYRTSIAAYFAAGDHVTSGRVKPVSEIARDLRISASTVSRWLKLNHRDLWLKYWHSK